ncbi:hypothetical protein BDV25DRAFT_162321 [Aspergillus avenaceus]|uniref:Ricin B lectin domain-containing protein n=1 Tax=Aspergillus avenaceus TaxID=36643 RepID=A0A5N6TJH4_ASPAV|nr:hypothetical protein BDV25DRAFT_162321 [Aspergillus avenaceus]
MNKLIFTLCDDVGGRQWHPFWNGNVVDHKSGNTFYIRSKSDPRVFWDEYQGKIYASQQGRTRFVITNRDKKYDGSVMIGSDSIWISPVRDKNYLVSVGNDRGLILDRNGSEFSFGDLKDSFLSSGDVGSARVVKDRNNGEEWELVA